MLTPLHNYDVIRILVQNGAETSHLYNAYSEFFTKYSSKDPPKTPLHIIVAGQSASGKSTIIEALKSDDDDSCEMVESEEHTAGIIPSRHNSKIFGFTAWYDLAGQTEFYASHEAILNTVMSSSTPLILLLTDSRKSQELIQQDILYWMYFLKDHLGSKPRDIKPHVIIIFSFADKISDAEATSIISYCKEALKLFIQNNELDIVSFLSLDCRVPNSAKMCELRSKIKTSATMIHEELPIHFLLHCFYAFLVRSFDLYPAVTIETVMSMRHNWISSGRDPLEEHEEVSSEISEDSDISEDVDENEIAKEIPAKLIPNDREEIFDLCMKLHQNGHIIVIKDHDNLENSWLIINQEILLNEINGSLFAPPHFRKPFRNLSTSTGVVHSTTVKTIFQNYDIDMLIGFLVHLEYCLEISDVDTLKLLYSDTNENEEERYLFFPGLVSIDKPVGAWKTSKCFNTCGWVLQVTDTNAFFTPRFTQVLLLRTAFQYPLCIKQRCIGIPILTLCRACSVWKNGISWRTENGIECLLEVTEGSQAVILMLRSTHFPLSGKDLSLFLFLRSSLIHKIMSTLAELSPTLDVEECYCHPRDVQYPPRRCEDMALYSLDSIARAMCSSRPKKFVACHQPEYDDIELISLVHFEPLLYCDIRHISNVDEDDVISERFLTNLAESIYSSSHRESLLYILGRCLDSPQLKSSQHILSKNWEGKSYRELKSHLGQYSIFRNRFERLKYCTSEEQYDLIEMETESVNKSSEKECATLIKIMCFQCINGEKIDIVREVGSKDYYKFGLLLLGEGMSSQIKVIEKDHKGDTIRIVREIIQLWLDGNGSTVSWESLISVLKDVELEQVAQKIVMKYSL